jgi:hypothetical protein
MKLHAEIVAELASLVVQRDTRPKGSMSRSTLNQRCMALAWVLDEHELAPLDLTLSYNELQIMECFE